MGRDPCGVTKHIVEGVGGFRRLVIQTYSRQNGTVDRSEIWYIRLVGSRAHE